jgi:hypothetical protein
MNIVTIQYAEAIEGECVAGDSRGCGLGGSINGSGWGHGASVSGDGSRGYHNGDGCTPELSLEDAQ